MTAVYVETRDVPISDLTRFPGNAKKGSVGDIRDSIRRTGQYRSLVVRRCDDGTLLVLARNHTMQALDGEGYETARCEIVTCDDQDARRINLADNRLAELGGYDNDALAELLSYMDGDYEGTGYTDEDVMRLITPPDLDGLMDDDAAPEPADKPSLADRFLIPPFDVLDARQGWWRKRKQQWLSLGIVSEVGRDGNLAFADVSMADPEYYRKKEEAQQQAGRALTNSEFEADYYTPLETSWSGGTSVFDPVMCELAYRWFSPAGGTVLDPFAGGSVRGIVAGLLGRSYRGNDLRPEQVESNREQRDEFTRRGLLAADPAWSVGDSADWVTTLDAESADLVFTCPPYYDLEEYSSDPADLSAMSYDDFDAAYARIIAGAARALRQDRFAVFVVGDARDTKGALHDLRGSTIRAATAAGLTYASGGVLITPVGSTAIMAGKVFAATRGLGRVHQDVLVFCKGSRSRAAQACGEVNVHMPDGVEDVFADDGEELPEAA